MIFAKSKIFSKYVSLDKISEDDKRNMYGIFELYYEGTDFHTFEYDLNKKTGVILLLKRSDKQIVGFSTVTDCQFTLANGKKARGIFSGDTIIEREYWGSRALQIQFFIHCVKKLLTGTTPLYWLLISKGYKTYLLLANNFVDYYPHPKGKSAHLEDVASSYCMHLYPEAYDAEAKLLDFGDSYQKLKGQVADITDIEREREPKISFFEERNPTWKNGTELPCVGVISYKAALSYVIILARKLFKKKGDKGRSPAVLKAKRIVS